MSESQMAQSSAQNSGSGSTQLEFTQAMTDFKVMFPEMDAEVIEAVLRANNGAVDATIDHLLAMSADNEMEKATRNDTSQSQQSESQSNSDQPPAYIGHHPPSYQQATTNSKPEVETDDLINLGGATSLLNPAGGGTESHNFDPLEPSPTKEVKHAYSHPKRQEAEDQKFEQQQQQTQQTTGILPTQQQLHEIYEENLRLSKSSSSGPSHQYLEDERIALMLQNEEFMAELQRDSDFMNALEMEQERAFYQKSQNVPKNSKMMDSDEFRDKLKNMGKTSKRKFSQMAAMFSRRKSAAKQFLGQATAPSKDNLLLNAEPLVNEDSDGEDEPKKEQSKENDKKTPTKGKYTSFS